MNKDEKKRKLDAIFIDKSLSQERKALLMMKELERKKKRKLKTHRLDDRTVICTTKDRLPALIEAHTKNLKRP